MKIKLIHCTNPLTLTFSSSSIKFAINVRSQQLVFKTTILCKIYLEFTRFDKKYLFEVKV